MFATFGQPKEFKQFYQYSKNLLDISNKTLERAKASSSFGRSLLLLMKLEAPKYAIYFEPIMKEYEKLSISYATASKIQRFAWEDLNDIVVRFPVLQRKEQEKAKLIQIYNLANKKYKESKLAFKKVSSQENQIKLTQNRNERARLAESLIEKSDECISYQARFDRFVQNRSSSSWRRFSLSMAKLYHEETEIMNNLSAYIAHFKNNIDDPEKILHFSISKIEQVNETLKINKSSPAINPSTVHIPEQPKQSAQSNESKQSKGNEKRIKLEKNDSEMSNEEFQRLTQSMLPDFNVSLDVTGIDYINSDDESEHSDDFLVGSSPADLKISHIDEDELIRELLGEK